MSRRSLILGGIAGLFVPGSSWAQAADADADSVIARLTAMADASLADPALDGASFDYVQPFAKALRKARAGKADAQLDVGVAYMTGEGIELDRSEAVRWFEKAAAQGNMGGAYNLGLCYRFGLGVDKDPAAAIRWFLQAGVNRTPLAFMYAKGEGTAQDQAAAVQLFARAGDHWDDIGAYEAGLFLAIGRGVAQDFASAWYYLSIAVNGRRLPSATVARDLVAPLLTKAQLLDVQSKFNAWRSQMPGR